MSINFNKFIPAQFQGFSEDECLDYLESINSFSNKEASKVLLDHYRLNARKLVELLFTNYLYKGDAPKDIWKNSILNTIYDRSYEENITDHRGIFSEFSHPSLRCLGPFPDLSIFSKTDLYWLMKATELFKNEYSNFSAKPGIDTRENIYIGKWRAIELMRDDLMCPSSRFFPKSLNALNQIELFSGQPGVYSSGSKMVAKRIVTISRLYPDSNILPHFGISQSRLRVHIPLSIPKTNCSIYCYDTKMKWDESVPLVLNDTYVHWVDNYSDIVREVVLVDIHHPDLFNI